MLNILKINADLFYYKDLKEIGTFCSDQNVTGDGQWSIYLHNNFCDYPSLFVCPDVCHVYAHLINTACLKPDPK